MEIFNIENAPAPVGPYSQAIKHNGLLFISGQIPLNPISGTLVNSGIVDETTQVMENLKALLEAAGMSLNNVLKTSIFLSDMGDYDAVNEVYAKYFTHHKPARECVAVRELPKSVNVEISLIAAE